MHEDCRASAERALLKKTGGGFARRKTFLSEIQPMKRVISVAVGARTSILNGKL